MASFFEKIRKLSIVEFYNIKSLFIDFINSEPSIKDDDLLEINISYKHKLYNVNFVVYQMQMNNKVNVIKDNFLYQKITHLPNFYEKEIKTNSLVLRQAKNELNLNKITIDNNIGFNDLDKVISAFHKTTLEKKVTIKDNIFYQEVYFNLLTSNENIEKKIIIPLLKNMPNDIEEVLYSKGEVTFLLD